MLHQTLKSIAEEYEFARGKDYSSSPLSVKITKTLSSDAKETLKEFGLQFRVKASAGQFQNWAAIPWLAFFDPLITTTAQSGFYVVYLINPLERTVVLSLNQGATETYREFGEKGGIGVLQRRAKDIASRMHDFADRFSTSPIALGSLRPLPLGYEAGHAFGRTYELEALNSDQFYTDLRTILHAYKALVFRGGIMPTEVMQYESGVTDIVETRKAVLSKRIERAPNVRRKVLSVRKPIYEACGLDPSQDYSYCGDPIKTPLDVHHSRPLSSLTEDEEAAYKVPDDFLVLCPTCHRVIHKQDDVSDLEALKDKIRFKHAREGKIGLG
ncbi:MrcB family domain-containing protein [Oceanicola sp. S124]|uniref:MrcB family domain-containing protein n=1 Tax=Oceanicola sp. S124 TaxID=1042378 RepID=UPI0009FC7EAC|nr:DUF3578 domain-containing protein [Oceanicola sp. S124]